MFKVIYFVFIILLIVMVTISLFPIHILHSFLTSGGDFNRFKENMNEYKEMCNDLISK